MSLSSNLDLDAIKDILTDRGIDWSVPWTPDMFIDGWEECRGTISDALNAFPKLVEECERLRQELHTAKRVGAAEWQPISGARLEPNRYYLAWRPERHMAFMLTGQQIDLMNESSTAEHLSMELTHYQEMPDGPAELRAEVGR